MKILILIMMFFVVGALFIISNNNLHLNESTEFGKFYDSYYLWMEQLFGNVKYVTGYLVKVQWLPSNSTVK